MASTNPPASLPQWVIGRYIHRVQTRTAYPNTDAWAFAKELAQHYLDPKSGFASPSQEELAETYGVSVRTVRKWVADLKKSGLWNVNGGTPCKTKDGVDTFVVNQYYPRFLGEVREYMNNENSGRKTPRASKAKVVSEPATSPREALETLEATTTPEEPEMPHKPAQEPADNAWMHDPYTDVPLFDDEPDYFPEPDWNE